MVDELWAIKTELKNQLASRLKFHLAQLDIKSSKTVSVFTFNACF